ncbi:hypothetical protein L596_029828 [Steinernema carpocapsae]|uniref:Uncharacterized protein n=1 Tax=Steinernema carpocapsae TaxID=34508 RepID=A0A4V5ZX37_STECR|nr:hypothetical protein L596_029817 [Steinernema carpocapsae]TKR58375.1 hypothetical protein L596_029828 [Steinernema carpocapsae]
MSGAEGGVRYSEIDELVLAILDQESAAVKGLDISETWEAPSEMEDMKWRMRRLAETRKQSATYRSEGK